MPVTMNGMKKSKKAGKKKPSAKQAADHATEQIVRMIAENLASLPKKERLAAMEAFDLAADALSTRGKKASTPRKTPVSRPSSKPRKGS